MEQTKSKRTFRIIFRTFILLTMMVGVFFASFFATIAMKTERPIEIIKYIMASESERKKMEIALPTVEEPKVKEKQSDKTKFDESKYRDERNVDEQNVDERNVDEKNVDEKNVDERNVDERNVDERVKESTSESQIARTSLKQKIARLKGIEEAVAEKLKKNEHYVPLDEIPLSLRQAIIAIEDSRFYSHKGLDPSGIARATIVNVEAGQIEEGGSTITQQLAKNLFLTQEQSFTRKIEEIMLAINLERHFSKDEILEMYLNTIYFGSNFYGVWEAAKGYFGKEPSELTLAESAMLAGLPQAPSAYSPYVDYMLAKKRQLTVIKAMVGANILTEREAERARVDTITLVDD